MTVRISYWDPDKGFGFIHADNRRVYVHANILHPKPQKGCDLTGWTLERAGICWTGEKGPFVTQAYILPRYEVIAEAGKPPVVQWTLPWWQKPKKRKLHSPRDIDRKWPESIVSSAEQALFAFLDNRRRRM